MYVPYYIGCVRWNYPPGTINVPFSYAGRDIRWIILFSNLFHPTSVGNDRGEQTITGDIRVEIRSAMASHYIYLPAIALILVFAISAIHMTDRWMDVDHYWNNINDLLDGKMPYSDYVFNTLPSRSSFS